MKKLLFVLLIISVILVAGCIQEATNGGEITLQCVEEGESPGPGEECCEGLDDLVGREPADNGEILILTASTCVNCGDSICNHPGENKYNCEEDCKDIDCVWFNDDGYCPLIQNPEWDIENWHLNEQACTDKCSSEITLNFSKEPLLYLDSEYKIEESLKLNYCECLGGKDDCMGTSEYRCSYMVEGEEVPKYTFYSHPQCKHYHIYRIQLTEYKSITEIIDQAYHDEGEFIDDNTFVIDDTGNYRKYISVVRASSGDAATIKIEYPQIPSPGCS